MKKGLCIILSALLVAFSFASCGKKNVSEEETKVDENGSAYIEVTDKDGNEVTSVLSEKEKSKADKNAAKTSSKETTTADTSEFVSKAESAMSGFTNVDEKDLASDKKDLIDNGETIKKTTLRDDVIGKIAKSGKFTLKMTVKAASGEDTPVTCANSGKKFAYELTMKGSQIRIIMDNSDVYVVLPALKGYFKTTTDEVGIESMDSIMSGIASSEETYVASTKVTVSGSEYTCEEYKKDDGSTIKYYFDKDNNWKRVESIDGDDVAIMEISSFTSTVDDNIFSVKGYNDMTALLSQMSGSSVTTTKKS